MYVYIEGGKIVNIKVQCCGIVLLLIILYIYVRRKKINFKTEKAFMALFGITLVNLTLDTVSIVVLTHHDEFTNIFINVICKTYLVSLVATAFGGVMYVVEDIYKNSRKKRRKVFCSMAVIFVVAGCCIALLPIHRVVESANKVYTYGPSVLVTYFFCVSILFYIVFLLCTRKEHMDIRRWDAMRIWMVLWLGAAVVQFLNNELLLVGFASALGVVITYLKLENPEIYFDKNTNYFSQDALLRYIKEKCNEDESCSLIEIIFPYSLGSHASEYGGAEVDAQIESYFSDMKDVLVFRKEDDEVVLAFDNPDSAMQHKKTIQSRFDYGWGSNGNVYITPKFLYMPDVSIVDHEEDLLQIFRYARNSVKHNVVGGMILIDYDLIVDMLQEKAVEILVADSIENNRIEVFYQPIYSVEDKKFTTAEALVRIIDENGLIIPPGVFIDVIEKNGMILKLGEIVFEKVCKYIAEENPMQYGIKYIEVNLSVVQCAYEYLADSFLRILEKYNVAPELINLEITESASVESKEILLNNMQKLMDSGVKFSLDDFGTGQSNLNYIVEMPVDIVKFDRNMVNEYFANNKAKYVMDAAMHMIHGMQLKIVSEGIETKDQFDIMSGLGISYIQGYYFSKPLPKDDFTEFIKSNNKGDK